MPSAMTEARVIIFTGAGPKAFCAGGDLREEKDFGDPDNARAFRTLGRNTLNRIENGKLPVIAGNPRLLHRRRHCARLDLRHPRRSG